MPYRRRTAKSLFALGLDTGEMALAAGQVIGRRLPLMAAGFANPVAADWPELLGMVAEKTEAAAEWQMAALAGWMRLGGLTAALALDQSRLAWSAFGGAPVGWFTAGVSVSERLAAETARMASEGLAPYHRRVRANARRLGRRRAKS